MLNNLYALILIFIAFPGIAQQPLTSLKSPDSKIQIEIFNQPEIYIDVEVNNEKKVRFSKLGINSDIMFDHGFTIEKLEATEHNQKYKTKLSEKTGYRKGLSIDVDSSS